MNDDFNKISPEDPRLTAYALGELEGEERGLIEAALRDDPAVQAVVKEIQATVAQLEGAFAAEPLPEAGQLPQREAMPAYRAAIIPGRDFSKLDGGSLKTLKKVIQFPQAYYLISGLAAACFAVFVVSHDPGERLSAPKVKKSEARSVLTQVSLSMPVAVDSQAAAETSDTVQLQRFSAAGPTAAGSSETSSAASATNVAALAIDRAAAASQKEVQKNFRALEKDLSLLAQSGTMPTPGSAGSNELPNIHFSNLDSSQVKAQLTTGRTASAGGSRGVALKTSWAGGTDLLTDNRVRTLSGNDKFVVEAQARGMTTFAVAATSRETPRTESYAYRKDNDFLGAAENPLSTFSADVDTASYANVRRMLRAGHRPPPDAVRVEEMLNYFSYRYAAPTGTAASGTPAFAATLEIAEAPWATDHRLVRIGLKAREVAANERGAANLVFLVDVSGSMDRPERLPLVKESLRVLVNRLRPDDRVAVVTYAGASGLALASTPVTQAREITAALEAMTPGGATNGSMGIQLAYDIAKSNFVAGGVNRVILCTDGDFNVGVTGEGELVRLVQEKAKTGVFLSVLGFGMGNLRDSMLEAIADKGNGSYGYIDSRREAEKLLGAQVNGTLTTVAKDVKLQVEFNPARVSSYRLIGYENRLLGKEDFNNDKIDAGEVGAGHTMTALYEIVPAGTTALALAAGLDDLKYTRKAVTVPLAAASMELLTVKVRYKEPAGDESRKLEFALSDSGARFANASGDFKFASAVAAFGMILRDSPHKGTATLNDVATWAEAGAADDPSGWRGEFVELARVTDSAR